MRCSFTSLAFWLVMALASGCIASSDEKRNQEERKKSAQDNSERSKKMCLCGDCPAPGAAANIMLTPETKNFAIKVEFVPTFSLLREYVVSAGLIGKLKEPIIDPRPCGGIETQVESLLAELDIDPFSDKDSQQHQIRSDGDGVTALALELSHEHDAKFYDSISELEVWVSLTYRNESLPYIVPHSNFSASFTERKLSADSFAGTVTFKMPEDIEEDWQKAKDVWESDQED